MSSSKAAFVKGLTLVGICAALAACGGGGGGNPLPSGGGGGSPTPSPTPCPSGYTGSPPNCTPVTTATATATVQPSATTVPLPSVGGYAAESLSLPAGSGALSITVSTQPPTGTVQLQDVYRRTSDVRTMTSGNTPYLYFTLTASGGAVSLSQLPGLGITLTSSAPQDTNYHVAEWDPVGNGWYDAGETSNLSFTTWQLALSPASAPATNGITLAANQSIYLSVYHGTTVPSPAPQSVISGKVVDYDTNAAIAGATVEVVPLESFQSTASPTPIATATTAADGTFTTPSFTTAGHRAVVQGGSSPNMALFVLPPAGSSTAYAAAHTWLDVASGTNALSNTIPLVALSSDEQAWIAQINSDRAANGAFGNLTADSYLMLAARWKAKDEQLGSYGCSHSIDPTATYYTSIGGIGAPNENLACFGSTTWQAAEQSFMAEKGTSNDGHYLNIINPNNIYVGVGIYVVPASGSNSAQGTAAEEFLPTF